LWREFIRFKLREAAVAAAQVVGFRLREWIADRMADRVVERWEAVTPEQRECWFDLAATQQQGALSRVRANRS
jgi:hypothetical protein